MRKSIQNSTFKESPDSWQMKIQTFTRLPFPLAWIVIALILFLVGYAVIRSENEQINALRLIILHSTLIAAIANSVVFYEKLLDEVADNLHYLLDEPEEKSKNWINRYYTIIFWSNKNIIVGLILGGICLFTLAPAGNIVPLQLGEKAHRQIGTAIAGEAIRQLQFVRTTDEVTLKALRKIIDLPVKKTTSAGIDDQGDTADAAMNCRLVKSLLLISRSFPL